MMNFSPDNRQGLLGLLAGLQHGMDPTTAYGMYQDIQNQQEQQLAMRKERQSGLIGMLQQLAMGGMPAAGAEAMLESAPGPMGPALQSAMDTLYPTQDAVAPAPPMNVEGQPIEPPPGYYDSVDPSLMGPSGMPNVGPQATSVAYQPPVPSISEQLAMQEADMEAQQTADQQADLTALQMDAAQARAAEWSVDDFLMKAQAENPELFAMYPEEAMAIVEGTFGSMAMDTRGMPGV